MRVWTPSGPRAIETLAVGDELWSVDPATGERVCTRIVATRGGVRECMAIEAGGRRLVLTSTHPVWDVVAGVYREAGALVEDADARVLVMQADGSALAMKIDRVERYVGLHEVFDLSVDDPRRNFVAEWMLVHNKSDDSGYYTYDDDDTTVELDGPSTVEVGSEVLLQATPSDLAATLQWSLPAAPEGSEAALPNGERMHETFARNTRFTADVEGEYRVTVVAVDGSEMSDPASVRIVAEAPTSSSSSTAADDEGTATENTTTDGTSTDGTTTDGTSTGDDTTASNGTTGEEASTTETAATSTSSDSTGTK
jgi:hypothetical protein